MVHHGQKGNEAHYLSELSRSWGLMRLEQGYFPPILLFGADIRLPRSVRFLHHEFVLDPVI